VDPNPEKRVETRFRHVSNITYEDLEQGVYSQSKMFNYSKGGLYFESDLEIDVGESVFIGIENSPYAKEANVYECYHVVVKRRQKLNRSVFKYGYGVQYENPPQEQDPNTLTGRPVEVLSEEIQPEDAQPEAQDIQVRKDLRRHERISLSKTINYFTKNQVFKGRITNISPSGAFIETGHRFLVGQTLVIALPFIKQGTMVKAEIVWKNDQGIGIKFKRRKKK
jgi:Tfp pilus assembly protein PilZ